MKLSEKIKNLKAEHARKLKEMNDIEEASGDSTKDEAQQEAFDTLMSECETIEKALKDAQRLEKMQVAQSKRVTVEEDEDDEEIDLDNPAPTSSGKKKVAALREKGVAGVQTVQLRKELAPGIMFARYIKCVGASRGDITMAAQMAKLHYPDTPQISQVIKAGLVNGMLADVLKTAVPGALPTDAAWAGPLMAYNQFAGDFIDFLRPKTIVGKFGTGNIPSLRAVPFNVHIRGQTTGGSAGWVGAGKPKPVTSFGFNDTYLGFSKVAAIAVLTEELLRFSNPSAEGLTRDALAGAIIERLDIDFIDPAKAAVANVSPASVTHGVTAIHSSGATAADIRADLASLIGTMVDSNLDMTNAVFIMPAIVAMRLGLIRNSFGQKEFPDVTVNGGVLEGIPVITSQYLPTDTAGATVILAVASEIYLADDGSVTVDASREASIQMLDNPTNSASDGTPTTMVSMYQTNSVALRAERYINWQKRRTAAVAVLDQVVWDGG